MVQGSRQGGLGLGGLWPELETLGMKLISYILSPKKYPLMHYVNKKKSSKDRP